MFLDFANKNKMVSSVMQDIILQKKGLVDRLEYFDDQAINENQPTSAASQAGTTEYEKKQEALNLPAILTKNFHAMGISFTLDNFRPCGTAGSAAVPDSLGNSPSVCTLC